MCEVNSADPFLARCFTTLPLTQLERFIFADVKRPAKEFREACERMGGVLIGRDFPPLTNWARISIGTADEMRVANDVFKKVLAAPATTASR